MFICLIHFICSSKITPKYFASDALLMSIQFEMHIALCFSLQLDVCNFIDMCSGLMVLDMQKGIKTDLLLFNIKLLLANHLFTIDRPILAFVSTSFQFSPSKNNTVSSANADILPFIFNSSRSFIYIENKIGPSTVP